MKLLTSQPILEQYHRPRPVVQRTLAIILIGHDPASEMYVKIKQRRAADYGVIVDLIRLPEETDFPTVEREIERLNRDEAVNGIIVQLPVPNDLEADQIVNAVAPAKDVDGLARDSRYVSPMVDSVQSLINYYQIDLNDKSVALIGYGRLVGQPIALWLNEQGIEPAIIDEETADRDYEIRAADIIFAGAGQSNVVNASNVRPGQIVFDCSGQDVDFEAVKDVVAAITPPKGAIGPLTVHFLLDHVLKGPQ